MLISRGTAPEQSVEWAHSSRMAGQTNV